MAVETHAAAPSLLVLSEIYHPGWTAHTDGVATPVLRADYILRAVPVPAGRSVVTLSFMPPGLIPGLLLTLLALLATAALPRVGPIRRWLAAMERDA